MEGSHYCGTCRCWKPTDEGRWLQRGRGGRVRLWKCDTCRGNAKKPQSDRDQFGKHMSAVNRTAKQHKTQGAIAARKALERIDHAN